MQNELWKKYNFSNLAIAQLLSGHYLDRDEAEKELEQTSARLGKANGNLEDRTGTSPRQKYRFNAVSSF